MSEKILRRIKIRLLPTKEQEELMWATAHTCREVWNWALRLNMDWYEVKGKILNCNEIRKIFKDSIDGGQMFQWVKEQKLPIKAFNEVFRILCDAYQKFFKTMKKRGLFTKKTLQKCARQNRKPTAYEMNGHPKFKSKKRNWKPSFMDRNDMIHFETRKVKNANGIEQTKTYAVLAKIGWVEIQTDYNLPLGTKTGKIHKPVITFVDGKWMLSCALEREKQAPKLNNYSIGIDLGLEKLAVVSYNFVKSIVFKNINKDREIRVLERKLKKYQRKLSRCYEKNARPLPDMSNLTDFQKDFIKHLLKELKYYETRQVKILKYRIQKLYRKLSNKRRDYIHKITRQLVHMLPKRIVLEDLKISNMVKNKHLSKAIYDALWYFFRQCITYKAEEYGIEVVIADTWYPSSKTCSFCGNINRNLKLKQRTYVCPCCHSKLNRDLNAAKNLENYGM